MHNYKLFTLDRFFKTSNKRSSDNRVPNPWRNSARKPADLERLENVTYYEMTVTFKPNKYQASKDPNTQIYTLFKDLIERYILRKIHKSQTYYTFYAMPEFTKKGILHFHCVMYFDNANDYHCNNLIVYSNRHFGNTIGKEIYKMENFLKYISKDYSPKNHFQPIFLQKGHKMKQESEA